MFVCFDVAFGWCFCFGGERGVVVMFSLLRLCLVIVALVVFVILIVVTRIHYIYSFLCYDQVSTLVNTIFFLCYDH